MQIISDVNYESISRRAADLIAEEVQQRPDLLLCVAAGNSPTRTYELLGEMAENRQQLFRHIRLLKLDEWSGLDRCDPATCESYVHKYLVGPLRISSDRYFGFQSDSEDLQAECRRMRRLDRHGRIDVCVLGLGMNGHVGFNEPASFLEPFIHVMRLTEDSLLHPMLDGANGTVEWGLTIGMADILHARKIVLIVNGQHKRQPLRRFLSGRIDTSFPASLLWLHPNITCLCDASAIKDHDVGIDRSLTEPHFWITPHAESKQAMQRPVSN